MKSLTKFKIMIVYSDHTLVDLWDWTKYTEIDDFNTVVNLSNLMSIVKKVENYFLDSKNKTDEQRENIVIEIKESIEKEFINLTTEAQVKLMNFISESTINSLRSSDNNERKIGLVLINYLIDLEINDYGLKLQCLKDITGFIPGADIPLMELNASIFIKYVKIRSITSDMFDQELKKTKKFLTDENTERKCYALILFKECSKSLSTLFFPYLIESFQLVCACAVEQKAPMRDIALELIKQAFIIFVPRENRDIAIKRCYDTLFKIISSYILPGASKNLPDESIIGSLMGLKEIINQCAGCMQSISDDICSSFTITAGTVDVSENISDIITLEPILTSSKLLSSRNLDEEISPKLSPMFSSLCFSIINANYASLMDHLLKLFLNKNLNVVQLSVSIISILSGFDKLKFVDLYLSLYIKTILTLLTNTKEKSCCYLSLSVVCVVLEDKITPFIPKILEIISKNLPSKDQTTKWSKIVVDPMIIACLNNFARFCTGNNAAALHEMLRNILENSTLTPAIVTMLTRSSKYIKDSQLLIHTLVNIILYRILKPELPNLPVAETKFDVEAFHEEENCSLILLALRTLRILHLSDFDHKEDIYSAAQNYLTSPNKIIRLEAAKSCCLLISTTQPLKLNSLYKKEYEKFTLNALPTLKKIILVGISDTERDIRVIVLSKLSEFNAEQIYQLEMIKILLLGLHDESIYVQEILITLLGKISTRHPSMVIPALDKHLIECLTELKYHILDENNHYSLRILWRFISSAPRVAISCLQPIIRYLLPSLCDPNSSNDFVEALLVTLSDLTFFCSHRMTIHMPHMLSSITTLLANSNCPRVKQSAINCMILAIQYSGYSICKEEVYSEVVDSLLCIIKFEQNKTIKRLIIQAVGTIGARDPYKLRRKLTYIMESADTSNVDVSIKPWSDAHASKNIYEILHFYEIKNGLDEFYSGVCIDNLLKILADPSLSAYHSLVVQTIQNICIYLGIRCFQYLSQIFPSYMHVVRISSPDMQKIILEQLGKLVSLAKAKTRPYIHELFTLLVDVWIDSQHIGLQSTIVKVIEYLVCSIPDDASCYIPFIIPKISKILLSDRKDVDISTEYNQLATLLLSSIQRMGPYLKDHIFLIIPAVIKGFDRSSKPIPLQKLAMNTIQTLFLCNDLNDFVSPIIQAIIRALDTKPGLHSQALTLLNTLFEYTPVKMKIFIPIITLSLQRNKINSPELELLMSLITNTPSYQLNQESCYKKEQSIIALLQQRKKDIVGESVAPFTANRANIMKAFQTTQRVYREDWTDWLNRLTLEIIKESPSVIIRFCGIVSQTYPPFGRCLLNFAFFSCWRELNYKDRQILTNCLLNALELHDMNDIVFSILNLIEFLEHTQCERLLIKYNQLAKYAFNVSAYVKSLRYTEESLRICINVDVLQSLISLNTLLNNDDAAQGALVYATKYNLVDLTVQQRWLEKLHDWDKALELYEKKLPQKPNDIELLLGKMRCLEALCEWKQLDTILRDNFEKTEGSHREQISQIGARCSVGLGKWEHLQKYVDFIPHETLDGCLYRAICNIYTDSCAKAKIYIDQGRDLLESELTTILMESYERGYKSAMTCQIFSQLDEIINFKLFPYHETNIKTLWYSRIKNCKRLVSDWQMILDLETLVLQPVDNIETWLKFCVICMKEKRYSLCKNAFEKLLTPEQISLFNQAKIPDVDSALIMNYIKFMWSTNKQVEAFNLLNQFVEKILPIRLQNSSLIPMSTQPLNLKRIMAKSHLRLGKWNMRGVLGKENITDARDNFVTATEYGREWYKAWHSWAKINYEIVLNYKHNKTLPTISKQRQIIMDGKKLSSEETDIYIATTYALSAIRGFFKSIALSEKTAFQDTLRLLTLLFEFGEFPEVYEVIDQEIKCVKIDYWLQVVPQLIARIDTPKHMVRKMIQQLLMRVGSCHPQAFIYPLMVSSKSNNDSPRTLAVGEILKSISDHSPGLVEQANMISEELNRVSILWCEDWCSTIEEASKVFFNERNISLSLFILDSMHAKTNVEAKTPFEVSFHQSYENVLNQALQFRNSYSSTNDIRDLIEAWSIYYQIFKQLNKQNSRINLIDLQYVSPRLLMCRDLILAIPGTYQPQNKLISIQNVHSVMEVIGSKQKPRKLVIRGSDGHNYEFLLKAHEDLRQDERVMQLFGLLNNILANNQETFKRNLQIKQYSVTPLSTDSGLIGWVPDCDTLSSLIKDYRIKRNISKNIENILLSKHCKDYDRLDLLHKVEMFEYILDVTEDDDLSNTLWQKSMTSEIWYEKRTNFTRSLAVMSMVGYILGLGDRHPSNIMQERTTGRIIHIDFGDCFEVAMKREKFPEKVPFRLTRMLIKCMEITGIEGTFKTTSIKVMEVLRENKDSLLAVLEAFIYDPLLNWRLLENKNLQDLSPGPRLYPNGEDSLNESPKPSIIHLSHIVDSNSEQQIQPEILNKKAISVIHRVKDKLNGKDFKNENNNNVEIQIRSIKITANQRHSGTASLEVRGLMGNNPILLLIIAVISTRQP
ncbi:hypothetical protein HZS_5835, partial [Henneguya salminicola]